MLKNQKFSKEGNALLSAGVTLIPLEDKIQFRVSGKIMNKETEEIVPNNKILAADDEMWLAIFGGARGVKRFVKNKKTIRRVLMITELGYENCILSKK